MKGPMTTQSLRGMANARADALARRSHRRQRCPAANALDEDAGVQGVQRRVRRPARPRRGRDPRRATCRRSPTSSCEVTLPAEPDPRARQLSSRRAQQAGATSSSDRPPTSSPTATAATSSTRRRASSAATAARRFENETQEFKVAAPAERSTRRSACSACRRQPFVSIRRQRHHRRPGARLRLPPRRQHRHRLRLPARDRVRLPGRAMPGDDQVEHFVLAVRHHASRRSSASRRRCTATNARGRGTTHRPDDGARRHAFDLVDRRGARVRPYLVVKGVSGRRGAGMGLSARGRRLPGVIAAPESRSRPSAALRALAAGGATLTYTCAPPEAHGSRMESIATTTGFFDRDEIDQGSDPADPRSFPGGMVRTGEAPASTTTTPSS